jgi:hypothetical protein
MSEKKEETASFVLRLSQKIFKSEEGEPQIQWRGNIRHVQSGDETRFSSFESATEFVQSKLSDLTLKAVEDKPEEEQKGIIAKSFDFWKKVAATTPKLVIESIKDPKKQATHIQEQIQEQIHQLSDAIGQKIEDKIGSKIELENWVNLPKTDNREIIQMLSQMAEKIDILNQKVDELSKKKAK